MKTKKAPDNETVEDGGGCYVAGAVTPKKKKRERGYYWVRLRNSGLTMVASFDGKVWWIPGSSIMWKQSLFEKIADKIPFPESFKS